MEDRQDVRTAQAEPARCQNRQDVNPQKRKVTQAHAKPKDESQTSQETFCRKGRKQQRKDSTTDSRQPETNTCGTQSNRRETNQ